MPVLASVRHSASRRSATRFHKLEYQRTCRQPKAPHSCAKGGPRAPVRIACINVSAMPSLGGAPRRHVAAGTCLGHIANFAAKMRMERAPERKSDGASEAAAQPGCNDALVMVADTVIGVFDCSHSKENSDRYRTQNRGVSEAL